MAGFRGRPSNKRPVVEKIRRKCVGCGKIKEVGFLSEQDCIKNMVESSYYREQVCRVSDIMRTPALTIKPYLSVVELAQTLIKEKPRVYPIVDDDGVLVGTINRTAVLKAIDVQLRSGYQAAS